MTSPHLTHRHRKLADLSKKQGLDALAINPGPSLPYLTGLHFHMSERPVVVFFSADHPPIIVLPELEMLKMKNLPYEIEAFPYGEDPASWGQVFQEAMRAGGLEQSRIGIEPLALRVLELGFLEAAAPEAQFVSGEAAVVELRMRKDQGEVAHMRKAAQIAQAALHATLPMVKPGVTERQIASELALQLLRHGSQSPIAFAPIVSSGPNSANPHAFPSDRELVPGDLLVIDWGASVEGYLSDITRTFAIGEVAPEFELIAEIVEKANAAGRAAVKPGVPAGQVDDAARKVITEAGYGQYFTHRTGHGLGLEGHEEPYIRSGSQLPLEVGMSFTIEPGIYLPGRGGVRIEDDVVVAADGLESLTDLPRRLQVIEG
ncbi:MAG: aminopeptidase P family protein [Chloroflexi bacterium]|nr:aminopeptidase P family protein [Chloroflexota bacterium]